MTVGTSEKAVKCTTSHLRVTEVKFANLSCYSGLQVVLPVSRYLLVHDTLISLLAKWSRTSFVTVLAKLILSNLNCGALQVAEPKPAPARRARGKQEVKAPT